MLWLKETCTAINIESREISKDEQGKFILYFILKDIQVTTKSKFLMLEKIFRFFLFVETCAIFQPISTFYCYFYFFILIPAL